MVSLLVTLMVLGALQSGQCHRSSQEARRSLDFIPEFVERRNGPQIVAPDTPYIAAAGRYHLYYIDTCYSPEDARYIKAHLEHLSVLKDDEHIKIDEIEATAEVRKSTGETIFEFNPVYARVMFAAGINRRNPNIKLPEHEPPGSWMVSYEPGSGEMQEPGRDSRGDGCATAKCRTRQTERPRGLARNMKSSDWRAPPSPDAIGSCRSRCARKVDTPRHEGESDTDYYLRMDKLHWGEKKVTVADDDGAAQEGRKDDPIVECASTGGVGERVSFNAKVVEGRRQLWVPGISIPV